MRRLAVLLLVPTLLVAACGGDDDEPVIEDGAPSEQPSEDTSDDEAPADEAHTDEELEALLLTVADLPSGWSLDPTADDDDSDGEGGEDDDEGMPECFQDGPEGDDSTATATASFLGGEDFPALEQSIDAYDPETLDEEMDAVAEALDECGDFTVTEDDIEMSGRITRLEDFPTYGDRTEAWEMTMGAMGFEFSFLMAFGIEDDLVVSFFYSDLGRDAVEDAEPLFEKAMEKLTA